MEEIKQEYPEGLKVMGTINFSDHKDAKFYAEALNRKVDFL